MKNITNKSNAIKSIRIGKLFHLYLPLMSRCVTGYTSGKEGSIEVVFSYGITHGQSLSKSFGKYLHKLDNENKAMTMLVLERFDVVSLSWKPEIAINPSVVTLENSQDSVDALAMNFIKFDGNMLHTDKREIESVVNWLEEEHPKH